MISKSSQAIERPDTYEFDEFIFDAQIEVLFRGEETILLPPKACELLGVLLENHGRVISRDDLISRVWNDAFVEEANLTHHISALRKALGETSERKFIETIPRKGYRFVAPVKQARGGGATDSASSEIVISERDSFTVIEAATFEAENPGGTQKAISINENVPPVSARKTSRKAVAISVAGLVILLLGAAAFFVYRNFYSPKNSTAPTEIKIKRLTPDMDATAPSVSPDGAAVVYVKNENGQRSLWRKQIASGEMTPLTPVASAKDVTIPSTRFSPDGRWIYFTKIFWDEIEKTLTVYRIPASGGAEQKILAGLDLNADFSISPDGRKIAYAFDWRQVIVFEIETGEKRIVAERDGAKQVIQTTRSSPAWSPDGSRLIFSGSTIEENRYVEELFEINLLTGAERAIPNIENFPVDQIEWLADDSGLIVTSDSRIWQLDYRTGTKRQISNGTDEFCCFRMSADSKVIIAQQLLGQYNIWTAPADNIDKRRQITIGGAARQGLNGLAVTPSGKILYTSIENGTSDIWIMNADGSGRRQLTVNAGKYNGGMWVTGDERYIVFMSTRSGTNQVWRMDIDGGNPVQLSKGRENYNLSLSPENDVYYTIFSAGKQKYQIYKVPVAGGEPVEIDDFQSSWQPQFSPDGKWILIFGGKTKDENPRTCIIDRATGKIVRYFDNGFAPRGWMPDSKAIVDSMSQTQQLWRQPIDGSAAEKIYDLSPLKIARWDFSADGKQVVFSLGNSTSEIVAIQNFSENSK